MEPQEFITNFFRTLPVSYVSVLRGRDLNVHRAPAAALQHKKNKSFCSKFQQHQFKQQQQHEMQQIKLDWILVVVVQLGHRKLDFVVQLGPTITRYEV